MYNKLKEEQKERVSYQSDEVDLRHVFDKIGSGFRSLKYKVDYLINLIIRNPIVVLSFLLLGLGIGYSYFLTKKPFYNSSMTLMLNKIRNEFVEDQLKKLSDMIDDGNHAAIASRLDISQEAAAGIRSLKVSNLDDDKIEDDSVLTGSPFRIDISLYNNQLFPTMETALADYLESNKFFTKQKLIKETQVRKVITKLQNDIESIDSVRVTVASPKGPVGGVIYGEAVDPTNLYRESVNMYKEQVELESDLNRLNSVEVINGFAPRIKPTGPQIELYLAVCGLLGLICGLMLANRFEKRRMDL